MDLAELRRTLTPAQRAELRAVVEARREAIRRHERHARHFREFARDFWIVAQPNHPVSWVPQYDAVCDLIQLHLERGWGTLVACMPVRMGKSTIFNVLAQAWDWLHRPSRQWLNISKLDRNASRDSRKTRKLIASPEYQALALHLGAPIELEHDQNQKINFVNTSGGSRQATTTNASLTGADVDVMVVDDVIDASAVEIATPEQAIERCAEVVDRFDNVWTDRFNPTTNVDHEPGVRLIVAQRLHPNDLPGVLMSRARAGAKDITIAVVPEVMDRQHPDRDFFLPSDNREDGEFLNPTIRGQVHRDAITDRPGGARKWATRHDQRPSAKTGTIILRAWIRTYPGEPSALRCDEQIITVDPAGIADAVGNDWSVVQVWGRIGGASYLLEETRGQWTISQLQSAYRAVTVRWPKARIRYVENTINGITLIRWANAQGIPTRPVQTKGADKRARAQDFIELAESGGVYVPEETTYPPVVDIVDEWCGFLAGAANDDRVDAAAYMGQHMTRRSRVTLDATFLDRAY